jgi:hypothetical protein
MRPEGSKDQRIRLNLYYPDTIEYYISKKKPETTRKAADFEEHQSAEVNPYNEVPIFQFRRERRKLLSELNDVLTLQDAINKLLSDMMVSAEFSAIIQRWVVTNADTTSMQQSPNDHWFIPAASTEGTEPTKVGQFSPADLNIFLNAMDKLAFAIAVITRTPKHYFFQTGGDPSGEALLTQESPHNKKCERYIRRMANTWQRVGAFLLKIDSGVVIPPEQIDPHFEDPATVQPKTRADIRKVDIESGIPLVTVLRREGWNEDELLQLQKDKAADKSAASASLAQSLMEAQRRMQQGAMAQPQPQGE